MTNHQALESVHIDKGLNRSLADLLPHLLKTKRAYYCSLVTNGTSIAHYSRYAVPCSVVCVYTSDVNDAELLMPSRDFHFQKKKKRARAETLAKRARAETLGN